MESTESTGLAWDESPAENKGWLLLRPVDVVVTLWAALASSALVLYGRQVSGWSTSAVAFGLMAVGPATLRLIDRKWPNRATRVAANFFPTLALLATYSNLDPLCDLLHPTLADAALIQIDQRLFGVTPALALKAPFAPWINDLLLSCYASYYLSPLAVAFMLFFLRREKDFDDYVLGVVLLVYANFLLYLAVPAVGPRFYLASEFRFPLEGSRIARALLHVFEHSPYYRDCFPSGHTAITLFTLAWAYRTSHKLFWLLLPTSTGLVAATLLCRFHYGIDLLAALPLAASAWIVTRWLSHTLPALHQRALQWEKQS